VVTILLVFPILGLTQGLVLARQVFFHVSHTSSPVQYNRDTCIPMFIAALFTIAKLWNQSKCPTAVE
jgi:hypothetical protein